MIAWRRPDVRVTMVERRAKRADLLRRAVDLVGPGGADDRTRLTDVAEVAADSGGRSTWSPPAASPTCRPPVVHRLGSLRRAVWLLVSEPPDGSLAAWACRSPTPNAADTGSTRAFVRSTDVVRASEVSRETSKPPLTTDADVPRGTSAAVAIRPNKQHIPLPCGAVDPTAPREQEPFLDDRNRTHYRRSSAVVPCPG